MSGSAVGVREARPQVGFCQGCVRVTVGVSSGSGDGKGRRWQGARVMGWSERRKWEVGCARG